MEWNERVIEIQYQIPPVLEGKGKHSVARSGAQQLGCTTPMRKGTGLRWRSQGLTAPAAPIPKCCTTSAPPEKMRLDSGGRYGVEQAENKHRSPIEKKHNPQLSTTAPPPQEGSGLTWGLSIFSKAPRWGFRRHFFWCVLLMYEKA